MANTVQNAARADVISIASIAKASLSASECAAFLPLAGKLVIDTDKARKQAAAKGASAKAIMVAAFASDDFASAQWAFDIKQSGGDVVEHVAIEGGAFFFEDDRKGSGSCAWAFNGDGALSQSSATAYKTGFLGHFFNLKEVNPSVWTNASRAMTIARAIRAVGATASIKGGALVVEGGSGALADTLQSAKSLAAMEKAAKGKTGKRTEDGTKASQNEHAVASPCEVLAAALAIVKASLKGDVALSGAALSNARAIADLIGKNVEAFADA